MVLTTYDQWGLSPRYIRATLRGADIRLRRAEEHMLELDDAIADYRRKLNFLEVAQSDPEPAFSVPESDEWIEASREANWRVRVLVEEVVHSLSTALDYVVFELAHLDSTLEHASTQFPICDTPEDFAAKRPDWLKGVDDAHVAGIEPLQPYPGRNNEWLALLRRLDNEGKHRSLQFVDAVIEPRDASARSIAEAEPFWGFSILLGMQDSVGVEIDAPFYVAFEDGTPVKKTLEILKSQVADVLDLFRPCFEGCAHRPTPPRQGIFPPRAPFPRI